MPAAAMPVPAVPVASSPMVASMNAGVAAPAVEPAATLGGGRGHGQEGNQEESRRGHAPGPNHPARHRWPPPARPPVTRRVHYTPGRANQSESASRVLRKASASHGMSSRAKSPTSLTSWESTAASRPGGRVTWYATITTGVSGYE